MLFSRSVDECRKLKSTDECLSKRDFFCAIGRMKILTLIYTMYLLTNFNFNKALKALLFIFISIALIIGIQKYYQGNLSFWGHTQTHYNNFLIFKSSYRHLIHHQNLYDLYEKEYGDFYKYSPTFAVFMAPFSILPDLPGLLLWNILNCVFLFCGVILLPKLSQKLKFFILAFSIVELITSLQNQQSNAMIAGFLLLAFSLIEKNKIVLSTLLIMLCFYTKLTGILACIFFLFYDQKLKFILWLFFWALVLGFLPLLLISSTQLIDQYQNWFILLTNDHTQSAGVSVYGILQSWTHCDLSKSGILIIGAVLFLLPLINTGRYKDYFFRLHYLCSLLIWIVIFNHKAESSSYILAFVACAIWFFTRPKSTLSISLFVLCIVLISLSPTDLFPKFIRNQYVQPYNLKALPAVICWIMIFFNLMSRKEIDEQNI